MQLFRNFLFCILLINFNIKANFEELFKELNLNLEQKMIKLDSILKFNESYYEDWQIIDDLNFDFDCFEPDEELDQKLEKNFLNMERFFKNINMFENKTEKDNCLKQFDLLKSKLSKIKKDQFSKKKFNEEKMLLITNELEKISTYKSAIVQISWGILSKSIKKIKK